MHAFLQLEPKPLTEFAARLFIFYTINVYLDELITFVTLNVMMDNIGYPAAG